MKKISFLFIIIATLFIYSCEEDKTSYTVEEFSNKFASIECGNSFTCSEDTKLNFLYDSKKECNEKQVSTLLAKYTKECKNFSEKDAYEFLACLESLSCDEDKYYNEEQNKCYGKIDKICGKEVSILN